METLRFLLVTTFYPPYHLGGDAVHVQYLAEALAARGHEVHVEFSPAAYRLKRGGSPRAVEGDGGVHLHPIPSPYGRAQPAAAYLTGRSRSISRFHAGVARDVRPDVLHFHNISLLGLGVLRPRARGMTVYTAHDYWVRCPRNDLLRNGRRPCETPSCVTCCLVSRRPPQIWRYTQGWRGLPGLDLAIAPSRFMARSVGPYLSCPVRHIPNFAPDPNPSEALTEPEDFYLFVGTLEHHKGVPQLADAACRPGGPRIRFVGRGSLARHLRSMRSRSPQNLEVEGWLSHRQLEPLYKAARALILPSTCHENAPLAAVEALAWGTPLLVSRRGGLEELLDGGAAGRSFEPTPEDIADAIRRFERDGLPRRLRIAARSAYMNTHRPESYLERYLEAIHNPREVGDNVSEAALAPGDPATARVVPLPEVRVS